MEIIRCEGLSKIYQAGENKVFALDNVDLTIEQGSFTAITGPSGSGKSTLLHLLSGLDTPSKGRVIYQGKNLYDYKDNQLSVLRRRRFGFVFQSYNLVRELTGWENILLPVVAIGGITRADLLPVLQTGVSGVAISGGILDAEQPVEETKAILRILEQSKQQ